jgi:hypothetical protein
MANIKRVIRGYVNASVQRLESSPPPYEVLHDARRAFASKEAYAEWATETLFQTIGHSSMLFVVFPFDGYDEDLTSEDSVPAELIRAYYDLLLKVGLTP